MLQEKRKEVAVKMAVKNLLGEQRTARNSCIIGGNKTKEVKNESTSYANIQETVFVY